VLANYLPLTPELCIIGLRGRSSNSARGGRGGRRWWRYMTNILTKHLVISEYKKQTNMFPTVELYS